MASKKSEESATSTVVEVPVPKGKVAVKDIESAAGIIAREKNAIPAEVNTKVCQYELLELKKKGDDRTYVVKISWGADVVSPDLEVADDNDERVKAIVAGSDPLA